MTLSNRIDLLVELGKYMAGNDAAWERAKQEASVQNAWFIPPFIDLAVQNIVNKFLQRDILEKWISDTPALKKESIPPRTIGLVMAGNIPLVGFHDFLCVFVCGHQALIKASSKDDVLIKHLIQQLISWEPSIKNDYRFADILKNCDAYIATGSNNTAGYFEYYFGKYPSLIRRNRTSVGFLTGNETAEELDLLTDDIHLYFGLGCRNVTHILVPEKYDFEPLIKAANKYHYLMDEHKYKNNYDYNLALFLLNHQYYMSSGSLLLVENSQFFSPVSVLHYSFYNNPSDSLAQLVNNNDIQGVIGRSYIPFGNAQSPLIDQYADGVNTIDFLSYLR